MMQQTEEMCDFYIILQLPYFMTHQNWSKFTQFNNFLTLHKSRGENTIDNMVDMHLIFVSKIGLVFMENDSL